MKVLAPRIFTSLLSIYQTQLGTAVAQPRPVCELCLQSLKGVGWIVGPLLLLGAFFVTVANVVQVGWSVSLKPLAPDIARLNPVSGLAKLFDMQALVRMGMGVVKMAAAAAVAALTLWQMHEAILSTAALGIPQLVACTGEVVYTLCLRLAIVLLILGIIDYAWQRYRFEQDLKMTKEEIKEEFRRMEGDPIIKQRRRQVQMQLLQQRMRYDVPKADVVITNPTHLAIAIKYDADTMSAPRVLAKGQDYMAQMIRQIAMEHGIPILERKPLAQALYKAVDVGQEIPKEFYKAIAEVLAYVYELSGRGFRRKSAMT